jgi:hypothetical protein
MFYQIYILTTKDFLDNNRTLFGPDLLASTLYVGDFLWTVKSGDIQETEMAEKSGPLSFRLNLQIKLTPASWEALN